MTHDDHSEGQVIREVLLIKHPIRQASQQV